MCHKSSLSQSRLFHGANRAQRGSMLVMAIFIMLVMALLGLTMINVIGASSRSVVDEVLGTRAMMAAQSGLQQVATQAFPLGNDSVQCDTAISSPAGFSQRGGLQSCRYTARCTTQDVVKAGVDHYFYRFSSTGICQAGDVWVSRTVSMDAMARVAL